MIKDPQKRAVLHKRCQVSHCNKKEDNSLSEPHPMNFLNSKSRRIWLLAENAG